MTNRILIKKTVQELKKRIKVSGWVNSRRDHGRLIFIDLRDFTGILQVVFDPKDKELLRLADGLRPSDVCEIEGVVAKRPEKMVNPNLETGEIELRAVKLTILSKSRVAPFDTSGDGYDINEEIRLKYRYLDLRRPRLQKNLRIRNETENFIRNYLTEKEFVEVETPVLTKSTPEGARDYVVPSRVRPGKFYALPQSPQQYKQLLMVAGIERYFQIVRCFRDEDTRGDRQPEFTQLDLEMSFVEQRDVMSVIENLFTLLVKKLFPQKKITMTPWPQISFKEAVAKYHTDKPDLRKDKNDLNELAFAWITDWPLFEWNDDEKRWDPYHHIFTSPKKEDLSFLTKDPGKVRSWQYDMVLNGYEVGGGSIRIHQPDLQKKIFNLVGIKEKEIYEKFGHLLEAFQYGAPPHGGIALGLDRILMIFQNEPNIREVMAFPKTGDGRDLMMGAPSDLSKSQLQELHIRIAATDSKQKQKE
jgi:aspartyl-tRNA synthetase